MQSFGNGEWDIAIGPTKPLVAEKADCGHDRCGYDLKHVAAPGREFAIAAQVERPADKKGLGSNSAADQLLRRTRKSAELLRLAGEGVEALRSGEADVWVANATNVQGDGDALSEAKVIPWALTTERHTVALMKGRSTAAQTKLAEIVNEAKRPGVGRRPVGDGQLNRPITNCDEMAPGPQYCCRCSLPSLGSAHRTEPWASI